MSDSMEVELLKQMMTERETRIELLKLKLSYCEQRQKQLQSELDQVKDDRENESMEQQGERIEWQHTHAETIKQLDQLTRDLNQQMASLQKYVTMLQKQLDKGQAQQLQQSDSSFVMQMQAQLCKAMHSQGIVDQQLRLAQNHSDAVAKQLRDALIFVQEERSRVELEFMNSLVKEDTETRELENGFKERLAEIQKEIAQLEDDLEDTSKGSDDEASENGEDDDDEDEENEEDAEEMKQAKQELMDALHEQKDKIAALEKTNEKQLRQISSLKRRIDNPDASAEFFASEELGMSYDDSESEGDETERVDDEYSAPARANGSISQASTEAEELPDEEEAVKRLSLEEDLASESGDEEIAAAEEEDNDDYEEEEPDKDGEA